MSILVLALMCALLAAVFAVQNAKPVAVAFLAWQFEISLVLVILGAAALGAAAVFLLGTVRLIKQSRLLKEADLRIKRLESDREHLEKPAEVKKDKKPAIDAGEVSQ